jgi:hypothetical protein
VGEESQESFAALSGNPEYEALVETVRQRLANP